MVSRELLKNNFPIVIMTLIAIPVLIAIMAMCIKINSILAPSPTDPIALAQQQNPGPCNGSPKSNKNGSSESMLEHMNDDLQVAKITNMTSLIICAVLLLSFFCIFLCSLKK